MYFNIGPVILYDKNLFVLVPEILTDLCKVPLVALHGISLIHSVVSPSLVSVSHVSSPLET